MKSAPQQGLPQSQSHSQHRRIYPPPSGCPARGLCLLQESRSAHASQQLSPGSHTPKTKTKSRHHLSCANPMPNLPGPDYTCSGPSQGKHVSSCLLGREATHALAVLCTTAAAAADSLLDHPRVSQARCWRRCSIMHVGRYYTVWTALPSTGSDRTWSSSDSRRAGRLRRRATAAPGAASGCWWPVPHQSS